MLLIAGIVVAVLLGATYAFLISLGESIPPSSVHGQGREFAANNAMDVTRQLVAWNAGEWNTSLAWDARGVLSTGLWNADLAGFDAVNSLLLSKGLTIWMEPNTTLAEQEYRRFRDANPGVECEAVGAFVLYNATLYTGGGVPFHACAVHVTCLDMNVQCRGLHLWRNEVVSVA